MNGFAIQLGFEKQANSRLTTIFESINSPVLKVGGVPHLSLAVFTSDESQQYIDVAVKLSTEFEPMQIEVVGVDSFPGSSHIAYLSVRLDSALATIHKRLHSILEENGLNSDHYYKRGIWTPHITLSMEDEAKKSFCLREIPKMNATGKYSVDTVRVIKFRPVQELKTMKLKPNHGMQSILVPCRTKIHTQN